MTFQEAFAGLQLVAEQEIGVKLRETARAEDEAHDNTMAALRREAT